MYCNLCGAEIPDDAETCPECGVDLRSADDNVGGQDSTTEPDTQSDRSGESAGNAADAPDPTTSQGQPASGGQASPRQGAGQPQQGHPQDTGAGQPAGGQGQAGAGGSPPGQAAGGQPHQGGHAGGQHGAGQPTGGGGGGPERSQPASGGGAPARGQPGGHGGFDFGALIDRLPLVPAAVGGAVVGILVFGIGIVVGALIPAIGDASALDLGATVTMDFHFGTPEHVTPYLFRDFQVADPPHALLGVLYLLPMVLLYQVGKLTVDFGWDGAVTTKDGAISGASVALGYLPIMLIAALLLPKMGDEFSLVTALILSGLVYPIVFGALGGLSASEFTPGQRRVGTLYGIVGFIAVFVGLFVSSYVFIDTEAISNAFVEIELGTLDRLFATMSVLAQTHSLSFGEVGDGFNTAIPILLTVLIVGAVGFLRVWRSHNVLSPIEAATRALTPAVAYTFLFGIVGSAALLFADPYVAEKVGVGFLAGMFAEALGAGPMANIGAYVTLVIKTLVVFPVIIGGSAGVFAWWVENRNRQQY